MAPSGKVTARDIAAACGTSVSAVSRAFRADGVIAPDLRRAILAMAAQRGYAPPAHRARAGRQALSFALVVGDIENPFYPQAMRAFAMQSRALGWDMRALIAPERGSVDSLMDQVLAADVDVVAIASAELSSTLAVTCRARGLPVVLFNRMQADAQLMAVCTDNYGGGARVAERFLAQGRQRVAYLGGRPGTSTHAERRSGFCDTLAAAGQGLAADLVGDFEYGTALRAAQTLLAEGHPDAVFCANDNMAFAVLDAAHAGGLQPGVDVAIIGYDDVPMAGWHRYQLTTISQQVPLMVAKTLEAMRRVTAQPDASGQVDIVPVSLVLRASG